jgi:CRISPR-associated endonuclease/helicase Cas3
MGLGKTEAAFTAAATLAKQLGHRGVYVALPTQATSNQMYNRLESFVGEVTPAHAEGVRLLHSRASLHAGPTQPRGVAADGDSATDAAAAEWFTARKRGILAQLGAGTIDQGLFGVLQTRHFFVRLFGLAGKVVVLDEVHAYDTYTSGLVEHLVRWLGRLNCSVILLSATLPKLKRDVLVEAYAGRSIDNESGSYPRITASSAAGSEVRPIHGGRGKAIAVEHVEAESRDWLDSLINAVADGGCAACVCNTVQNAQELYQALSEQVDGDTGLMLLHARFPQAQRKRIEDRVVDLFGKRGWSENRRPRRAILVGTQIIEQSLDLDFDLMISEFCPADLLLQRAGRMHRHDRIDGQPTVRPAGLETPRLWLQLPNTVEGIPPDFGVSECIYERYVLLRSWLSLIDSGRDVLHLPEDIETLVEEVYGRQSLVVPDEGWERTLTEAREAMEQRGRTDELNVEARTVFDPEEPAGLLGSHNRQLPDSEELASQISLALTRKTRPSVQLICLHETASGPSLDRDERHVVDLGHCPDREQQARLLSRLVTVTRWEVVQHFWNTEPPAAWKRVPLLRHCNPLVLPPAGREVGGVKVRLDPALGLMLDGG